MAQRILGLDLGASAVKAVLVESTFRGWTVIDAARARSARALPGRPGTPPRSGRSSRPAAGRPTSRWCAFPGTAGSTSVVTLPFTDPRRIEQTVGFEVEGQIPFDLADVPWDWQSLGVHDGKTELLVAVVRKDEVAALLAALAEVDIDPRAVVPPGPVYASLAAAGALAARRRPPSRPVRGRRPPPARRRPPPRPPAPAAAPAVEVVSTSATSGRASP